MAHVVFDSGRIGRQGKQDYRRVWHLQVGTVDPDIVKVDVKIDVSYAEQGHVSTALWRDGWQTVISLPGTWGPLLEAPSSYMPTEKQHQIDEWLQKMCDHLLAMTLDVIA